MTSDETGKDIARKRASAIGDMIASLRRGKAERYFVGLTGYYLEGTFYSASGLTVDLNATPDICETEIGFSCDAMFAPHLLKPKRLRQKAFGNRGSRAHARGRAGPIRSADG